MRALEGGLADTHRTLSVDPHPLLDPSLKLIARADDSAESDAQDYDSDRPADRTTSPLGTLHISQIGQSYWLGASAVNDAFVEPHNDPNLWFSQIPARFFGFFPAAAAQDPQAVLAWGLSMLPPKPEAWSLLECYYENGVSM